MELSDISLIYNREKKNLLVNLTKDNNPCAILLGGQSASGKGAIIDFVLNEHPDKNFLIVNGDNYRVYHPNYQELITRDIINFSEKTQLFSNIFTENLIKDAIVNNFNIIIEGTMRNAQTSVNTANLLRNNNYTVEAHIIATHPLLSEINLYCRYIEEETKFGMGRLADINIHNQAVTGLCRTIDLLYKNHLVNKISIYSPTEDILGQKNFILQKNKSYQLNQNEWNSKKLPSSFINEYRTEQEFNTKLLQRFYQKGLADIENVRDKKIKLAFEQALNNIDTNIQIVSKKGLSR